MRCLWPVAIVFVMAVPIAAQDMPLSQILIDGEGWKQVADGLKEPVFTLTSDAAGNVYVADSGAGRILRIDPAGKVSILADQLPGVYGLAFGPEGRLYASQPKLQRVVAIRPGGKQEVVAEGTVISYLVVTREGLLYCLGWQKDDVVMYVFILDSGGKRIRTIRLGDIVTPGPLMLWPDQGTLIVGHYQGIWAYRVEADRSLTCGQPYYAPRLESNSVMCRGLTLDTAGRLYATTGAGVQVFDPTGRLSGVLLKPADVPYGGITFGGPERDTLYVAYGDKIYARKTKAKGVPPAK